MSLLAILLNFSGTLGFIIYPSNNIIPVCFQIITICLSSSVSIPSETPMTRVTYLCYIVQRLEQTPCRSPGLSLKSSHSLLFCPTSSSCLSLPKLQLFRFNSRKRLDFVWFPPSSPVAWKLLRAVSLSTL